MATLLWKGWTKSTSLGLSLRDSGLIEPATNAPAKRTNGEDHWKEHKDTPKKKQKLEQPTWKIRSDEEEAEHRDEQEQHAAQEVREVGPSERGRHLREG